MEEPPVKVTKYEMESQYLEGEVMEEGQEEWLSEGILTDDDYNPASQQTEPDPSDSNLASQDETMNTASTENSQGQMDSSAQYSNASNIEETLTNFENSQNNNQASEFPEELNAFLIRKKDGKIIGGDAPKKESDVEESVKQSDDDGNDTDDLLRVLGDGDQSSKHIKKEKIQTKSEKHEDSSGDDDNYIFEGKKVKNFHVVQTILNSATATKAEPEDDITDCSSDEASTMKKIFSFKPSKPSTATTQIISSTVKPGNLTITPLKTKQDSPKIIKKVIEVPKKCSVPIKIEPVNDPKPLEVKRPPMARYQYVNKRVQQSSSLLKPQTDGKKDERCRSPEKRLSTSMSVDDTESSKETKPKQKQGLMCPEEMDEEVPTDGESDTDEEDLYSELPSSDSEIEDWFTLDIRAERAGDYIPLLGDKAYQLLSEEKRRVKVRLDTLKKSLSALSNSGRDVAEQLREATKTVAELDAMLKVV